MEVGPGVWPRRMPRSLPLPETSLHYNLEVSAKRYPNRTAIFYYGTEIPFARLYEEVEELAGYLPTRLGVTKGDRVMLYMQNSPQFVVGYYAILRAGAAVVPAAPLPRVADARWGTGRPVLVLLVAVEDDDTALLAPAAPGLDLHVCLALAAHCSRM